MILVRERSAGDPHAPFDAAGAGNVTMASRIAGHRESGGGPTGAYGRRARPRPHLLRLRHASRFRSVGGRASARQIAVRRSEKVTLALRGAGALVGVSAVGRSLQRPGAEDSGRQGVLRHCGAAAQPAAAADQFHRSRRTTWTSTSPCSSRRGSPRSPASAAAARPADARP